MELADVMRTTFAAREFTGQPVSDETLYDLIDLARFAPNGGNRQGWSAIVVRDPATKAEIARLGEPAARRYAAQRAAGESPWNTVSPTGVSDEVIAATPVPRGLTTPIIDATVLLVICVDLGVVASMDQYLDRVGIISGASVYPFAWNILLAARNAGLGGTITTMSVADEPAVKARLGIPEHIAVCALMPLGYPVKQLTRLKRLPVEAFTRHERWDGPALMRPDAT
jgi:nitroreductase